jgi:DNA-binding NarL/FixJ family response regulator
MGRRRAREVRVELREPVGASAAGLRAALAAGGLVVDGAGAADVIVWGADAHRLGEAGGTVPILALADRRDPAAAAALRAAGARGVVHRDEHPTTVAAAARAVAEGYAVFPVRRRSGVGEIGPLAPRELGWMRALARGRPVATLARAEGYSEREMYRKLRAVYAKLGAPSRTEALLALARARLLDAG